jgi:hypothetical protein
LGKKINYVFQLIPEIKVLTFVPYLDLQYKIINNFFCSPLPRLGEGLGGEGLRFIAPLTSQFWGELD